MTLGPGLRWIVELCRRDPGGPAAAFASGRPVERDTVESLVPRETLADLEHEGLLTVEETMLRLRLRCQSFNKLVSILPAEQQVDGDFVHLNTDTLWLVRLVWEHATPGDYAAELGSGNGIVAAHLVARYRRVIATDLPGPWLRYAQLTLEANKGRGRPSAVVACDVAAALRPGSFDLVAANSPWSPATPTDRQGNPLTFMAGGPTGTELPGRFLRQSAVLLRPGGTAVVLCFDPTFDDGSRPLMPILDGIRADGFDVELVDSAVFCPDTVTERLRHRRLPNLEHGRHVAAIIKRPG